FRLVAHLSFTRCRLPARCCSTATVLGFIKNSSRATNLWFPSKVGLMNGADRRRSIFLHCRNLVKTLPQFVKRSSPKSSLLVPLAQRRKKWKNSVTPFATTLCVDANQRCIELNASPSLRCTTRIQAYS